MLILFLIRTNVEKVDLCVDHARQILSYCVCKILRHHHQRAHFQPRCRRAFKLTISMLGLNDLRQIFQELSLRQGFQISEGSWKLKY